MKKLWIVLLALALVFSTACTSRSSVSSTDVSTSATETSEPSGSADTPSKEQAEVPDDSVDEEPEQTIAEDGAYTTKEDVLAYLIAYGHLPDNFITKKQAQALGWSGGSLEPYAPGKCIGGDRFGNYEKLLAIKDGRTYQECDIDTLGASSRGAKRIVFSNDGLIYYTDDHYSSFTLLYGEE